MLHKKNSEVIKENQIYKDTIRIIESTNDVTHYIMDCGDGQGHMISHHLFPGLDLIFVDFKAVKTHSNQLDPALPLLEINHCKRGRFERGYTERLLFYLGEGDLSISSVGAEYALDGGFPLGYYEGIEILIDIPVATQSLSNAIAGVSVDLEKIQQRLIMPLPCTVFHGVPSIDHIFSELYTTPAEMQERYFKVKMLELLLFLEFVPLEQHIVEPPYLQSSMIQKIKAIHDRLCEDLQEQIPLKALADENQISLTALKDGFRTVYGVSPYAWRKEYRISKAASLLKDTDKPVFEIAEEVGYQSTGKFTATFKDRMGITPLQYRKK